MPNLTTNFGLKKPLGNETADISVINENMDTIDAAIAARETPSGAQAKVDALAGEGNTTTVKALKDEVDAHKSENASTTAKGHVQLYNGTDSTSTTLAATAAAVKAAMDKANSAFQSANDIKTNWANVVGSPLLATDTSAQLKTKTQNIKNTLATNLTNKGQSAAGTETLTALVNKVANISTKAAYSSFSNIDANLVYADKDGFCKILYSSTDNKYYYNQYNNAGTLLKSVVPANIGSIGKLYGGGIYNGNKCYINFYASESKFYIYDANGTLLLTVPITYFTGNSSYSAAVSIRNNRILCHFNNTSNGNHYAEFCDTSGNKLMSIIISSPLNPFVNAFDQLMATYNNSSSLLVCGKKSDIIQEITNMRAVMCGLYLDI